MKNTIHQPFIFLLFLWSTLIPLTGNGQVQESETVPTQVVRGTIRDAENQMPLIGATVVVVGSDPILGTSADVNGSFKLQQVPLGRINLQVSFLGYQPKIIPNIVVSQGREMVLEIALEEALVELQAAEINASQQQGEALNEMAMISARAITTEEMNRLTAGFNDPALITSSYAGVATSGSGNNEIIVRGNSPKYVQWRLEGMPITNPNHFADQNSAGGATSALNSNLLATSDFYTGAFTAEFGNVLSGVYDIRLRNGNNEKREMIAGIGLLGTDLTLEGPFSKNYKGSYLVNYRYSTTGIFNQLGVLDIDGNPIFQDAAFKFHLPTNKAGVFSLYGLAGHSTLELEEVTPEDWNTPGNDEMREDVSQRYDKTSYLTNIGINHLFQLSPIAT